MEKDIILFEIETVSVQTSIMDEKDEIIDALEDAIKQGADLDNAETIVLKKGKKVIVLSNRKK